MVLPVGRVGTPGVLSSLFMNLGAWPRGGLQILRWTVWNLEHRPCSWIFPEIGNLIFFIVKAYCIGYWVSTVLFQIVPKLYDSSTPQFLRVWRNLGLHEPYLHPGTALILSKALNIWGKCSFFGSFVSQKQESAAEETGTGSLDGCRVATLYQGGGACEAQYCEKQWNEVNAHSSSPLQLVGGHHLNTEFPDGTSFSHLN